MFSPIVPLEDNLAKSDVRSTFLIVSRSGRFRYGIPNLFIEWKFQFSAILGNFFWLIPSSNKDTVKENGELLFSHTSGDMIPIL